MAEQRTQEQLVRRLWELTHASSDVVMQNALTAIRNLGPPDEVFELFAREFTIAEIEKRTLPLYLKHFDADTLDGVIGFYESPVGQTWLAAQPKAAIEAMAVVQDWCAELMEKAIAEFRENESRRARTIEQPDSLGTGIMFGTKSEADKTQSLLDARYTFVQQYCREHGWSERTEDLSLNQIMEIRQQDGWKNPVIA